MKKEWTRYVPSCLKAILRPLYYRLQKVMVKHKTRNELWEFWKHPDDGKNRPIDYLQGDARSQFLVELIKRYVEPDAKILEIGCNVGRNLNYLFNAGYIKLGGVEISEEAIILMKQAYPEMANQIKIWNSPVEPAIKNFEDGAFDVVFTMAVLEHIHHDSEFIFSEIVRISGKYIITIEDEKGVSWRHFPRNYKRIFEHLGTKQIYELNCREIEGLGPTFYVRGFKKVEEDNCE